MEASAFPVDNSKQVDEACIKESSLKRYCNGLIGVPITFLDKFNPEQFIIIGRADANIKDDMPQCYIKGFQDKGGAPLVKGCFLYKRILIKKEV